MCNRFKIFHSIYLKKKKIHSTDSRHCSKPGRSDIFPEAHLCLFEKCFFNKRQNGAQVTEQVLHFNLNGNFNLMSYSNERPPLSKNVYNKF